MENWMMWVGGIASLPYLMMLNHKFLTKIIGRFLNSDHIEKKIRYMEWENHNMFVGFGFAMYLLVIAAILSPYLLTFGMLDKYVTRKILINDLV